MTADAVAARQLHEAMSVGMEVTDLYTGDCRGCGECCSRFLPLSLIDRARLRAYVLANGIEPHEPRAEFDMLCPYLADDKTCAVYEARPGICESYRCDLHKRGVLKAFRGMMYAQVTDMREFAEEVAGEKDD